MRYIIYILIMISLFFSASASTLKVAFFDQDPYMFFKADGSRSGMLYEMVELLAHDEAIEVEYVNCKWRRCVELLRAGEIDLIPGMDHNKKRWSQVVFSKQHLFNSWSVLYTSKSFKLKSFSSLHGKRVGVVLNGSHYAKFRSILKSLGVIAHYVYLPDYRAVFEYMRRGEIDAGLIERYSGIKHAELYGAKVTSVEVSPVEVKLGFSRFAPAKVQKLFDERLAKYREVEGKAFYSIYEKYTVGKHPSFTLENEFSFALVAISLVLIVIMGAYCRHVLLQSGAIKDQSEQLDIALATSGLCRYIWDIKKDELTLSDDWIALFGYTHDEHPKNSRELLASVCPETKDIACNLFENYGELNDSYYKMELCIDAPAGRKWAYTTGRVTSRDRNGRPLKFIGFSQDITDIKANEANLEAVSHKLRLQIDLVEKANRAKSTFLANVSHDIRTPLNVILGISDMLSRSVQDDGLRSQIRMMRRSGQHLSELIHNVLDITAIESGKVDIVSESVYLAAIIDNIMSIMRGMVSKDSLKLVSTIDPNLPDFVVTDPTRLKRVLMNLMGNAVKFTESGEINLTVWRAGSSILFSVSDTGIGISKEMLGEVFSPFIRGESSYTKKFDGSGLGLAISRMIVDALGGEIQVDSAVGDGSRFYFELPLIEGQSIEKAAGADSGKLQKSYNLQGAKILLVDDAEPNRKLIDIYFKGFGVEIEEAENGIVALQKVKDKEYDAILMDLQMPEMDGFSAMQKIREFEIENERDPVFIVVLSAFGLKDEIDKAFEAGGNSFLAKPVRQEDLLSTVHNILKIR